MIAPPLPPMPPPQTNQWAVLHGLEGAGDPYETFAIVAYALGLLIQVATIGWILISEWVDYRKRTQWKW